MGVRATVFAGVGVLGLLAACSSGEGSAGTPDCGAYFDAVVAYFERCGSTSLTLANARPRFDLLCSRSLAAPGAPGFSTQLELCTARLRDAECGEDLACSSGTGTLENGTACGQDFQCKSGACKRPADSTCGTCAPAVPEGAPCDGTAECVEGATCRTVENGTSGERRCITPKVAKEGEPCSAPGETIRCEGSLRCRTSAGSASVCRPRGGSGTPCSSSADCTTDLRCVKDACAPGVAEGGDCDGSGECALDLVCATEKKCRRRIAVKAGEECDSVRRCERGSCKAPAGAPPSAPRRCVDPLPDGAACTSGATDGPDCDIFASCIGGKCTLPDPAACR